MRYSNQHSHVNFAIQELKRLLPDGSFASRLWRTIGKELHYQLVESQPDDGPDSLKFYPVDILFLWASKYGGLDPNLLKNEEGNYLDDAGEIVPPVVSPSYSDVEQLAAYGLWLISEKMNSYAPPAEQVNTDQGENLHECTKEGVGTHQSPYMLLAYQSLSYAQRILFGIKQIAGEAKRAATFNFSTLGRSGAIKRHAPLNELRAWAIELYRAGNWASANKAAHELKARVIERGNITAVSPNLTDSNAQRTIAEWFRQSV